ncbi:hypothetical protein HMPREF1557_01626 [Streptococcus sobrinus W1703]|uniref:Uncharacterized protein n=1 Tax=Streptococcus sobrinus W1703 TaxID=1227275 RepID=U2KB85_9STRE|nr:hypothetical protein HMPREF1557_01626 [Streptococcus sobrinus W1703]
MAAMEIRANPIFQILSLTNIDDGAVFILVDVAARTVRQQLQLVFNQLIHKDIITNLLGLLKDLKYQPIHPPILKLNKVELDFLTKGMIIRIL